MDINVVPAWQQGFSGFGVRVCVLDDGIEHDHDDLYRNYVSPKWTTHSSYPLQMAKLGGAPLSVLTNRLSIFPWRLFSHSKCVICTILGATEPQLALGIINAHNEGHYLLPKISHCDVTLLIPIQPVVYSGEATSMTLFYFCSYSTLLFPVRLGSRSLLPDGKKKVVGAHKRTMVGCHFCHNHWLLWDLNPLYANRVF